MRLGILSDTHKKVGRAKRAVDMLLQKGAEYLIHAGDIGKEEILAYMADCGVPYVAVLGNNDEKLKPLRARYRLVTEPYYFSLHTLRIKLMHHPWYLSDDADLIVCGHLHRFKAAVHGKTLYLNPGEVCARNKPISEAVLLEVRPESWIVTHCQRTLKEQVWHDNKKIYPR